MELIACLFRMQWKGMHRKMQRVLYFDTVHSRYEVGTERFYSYREVFLDNE